MEQKPSPFDSLDYAIIKALHQDARIAASEIARKLDANERTIRKRIERLERLGAIRMTAVVDPKTFGYNISVDIFLMISPDNENNIMQTLLNMPSVTYLAYGEGTNDISIEARFKNNDDMHEFLRRTLPRIPGVRVTGYALVPGIIRNIDEWLPPAEDFGISGAKK